MSEEQRQPVTQTTDAAIWAKEFMDTVWLHDLAVDEELMLGWFANAIETGRATGERKLGAEVERLREDNQGLRNQIVGLRDEMKRDQALEEAARALKEDHDTTST